jgi:hypothetical protein
MRSNSLFVQQRVKSCQLRPLPSYERKSFAKLRAVSMHWLAIWWVIWRFGALPS